jgi:hypothetical protein
MGIAIRLPQAWYPIFRPGTIEKEPSDAARRTTHLKNQGTTASMTTAVVHPPPSSGPLTRIPDTRIIGFPGVPRPENDWSLVESRASDTSP